MTGSGPPTDQLRSALLALRQARARIEALERAKCEPLAVIGAACRFPGGAGTPEAFWQLLRSGTDAITEVPADRWDISGLCDADPPAPGTTATRWGGFLDQVDQFDPQFFGISPREAGRMDPQQRLVLEVAWEAIERAGVAADTLAGSQTGVFLGASTYDYSLLAVKSPDAMRDTDLYHVTGSATNIIAGRLSYTLGLRGPSMVVDTACSSSLVAVHLAVQSLRSGECDLAVAGGVNLMLTPELSVMFAKAHMLSPDGRCKTFDAAADGFTRGEGCGIIVLRRLSDARARGDPILALIRGSAVNQDGRSGGLTAPNGQAQQAVIRHALANAQVRPFEIGYVEAHGTGTALGDPIEVQALAAALRSGPGPQEPVRVGALKTNIGHLEAAAGIAGLIKTILILQHQEIPPSLHLRRPNPHIPWDQLSVTVPTDLHPWCTQGPRLAGVSSFGFSGTNAHVVLEEAAPDPAPEPGSRPQYPLCLSAKTEPALRELAVSYQRHLADNPLVPLPDVVHTANCGRTHFSHRAVLIAGSSAELRDRLGALASSPVDAGGGVDGREWISGETRTREVRAAAGAPPVAFLFTGQGAQYPGMGRRLYETSPVFRAAVQRCDRLLTGKLDQPLLSVLYPEPGKTTPLDDTTYTQPALFVVGYALAQVWRTWGIVPAAVLGHSVGEYVAACVAGVLSLDEALELIVHRARLMGGLPAGGAMAAIFGGEQEVAADIAPHRNTLAIAAVNSPANTVISGAAAAVTDVSARFRARGTRVEPLPVSHAFHSPLMDPVLDSLESLAAGVHFTEPRIDLVSNLTGQRIPPGHTIDGRYLRRHAREPVRFMDGMRVLYDLGYRVFLELGPRPALLASGARCLPKDVGVWLPSLRNNRDDWQSMLESLAALYVHGVPVDWQGFDRDLPCRRTLLPTYPFQRQRYWAVRPASVLPGSPAAPSDPLAPADWLYQTQWRPQPATRSSRCQLGHRQLGGSGRATTPGLRRWVILADRSGVGGHLADSLRSYGETVDLIRAGTGREPAETLSRAPAGGTVIDLSGLDAAPLVADAAPPLPHNHREQCINVLRLVQTLAELPEPHRLWIVTRGAQPVRQAGEPVCLGQAPLWGIGRVIAVEHPQLWGGLVDLDPRLGGRPITDRDAAADARCLLGDIYPPVPAPPRFAGPAGQLDQADLAGPEPREGQIGWRDGQRHVVRLVRLDHRLARPVAMRPDATYAIAGGLGGLGGVVAAWLVRQGARHVALIGRSASSDSPSARAVEQMGARVGVFRADIAHPDQLARVLNEIRAGMPPLRGIIHAAGVLDDGLLVDQDATRFQRVMAPKVDGAWNLHVLTHGLPLDFFVLFSSIASLLGSPAQGNYAAANAFLDALAHHRRAFGLPAVAINWGPWDGAGMATRAGAAAARRWADTGLGWLTPQQGTLALGSLLRGPTAQVAVVPVDWARLAAAATADASGALGALLAESMSLVQWEPASAKRSGALPNQRGQWSALPQERRPEFLRHLLRRIAAHVLGMGSDEIPVDRDLPELGMDSLMVVEVVRGIERDLGLLLYPKELYDHPTVDRLAAYLDAELTKAATAPDAAREATGARHRPRPASVAANPVDESIDQGGAGPPRLIVRPPSPAANLASTDAASLAVPSGDVGMPDIVFLLSSPRSGSTLLRVMLAGHAQLFCPPELHLLPFATLAEQHQHLRRSYLHEGLQRALMELRGCDTAASEALLEEWVADGLSIREVYDRLRQMAAPRLLVDKSPTYAASMDTLHRARELFSGASFLCLVRHPYAVIESFSRMRMHRLIDIEEDPYVVAERAWVDANQNLLDFLRQIDPRRQHLVRYEDLVRQPEQTTDGICAFLGIAPDPAVLRPYDGGRMTDGVHGRSLAIGDPNFLSHDHIESGLADTWQTITLPHPLGRAARRLAAAFDYPVPASPDPAPAGGRCAAGGQGPPAQGTQCVPAAGTVATPPAAGEFRVPARGVRLRVSTWGPHDGPVIVVLHGILDHGMAWEEVAGPLAAGGYHVVAPDQRGHGRSGHAGTGGYQLLEYVADLEVLLDNLSTRNGKLGAPVMLVGHSMGAAIAATFASLRPERAGGLVLVEALMPAEHPEEAIADLLSARLRYLLSPPAHPVLPDTAVAAQRLRQAMPGLPASQARRMAERITKPCPDGVCWTWDPALLTRADLTYDTLAVTPTRYRALLARITTPVTLVYGRADHPHLAQLRLALPRATAEVLPGGHNLHIDAPARLADAIARSAAQAGVIPGG